MLAFPILAIGGIIHSAASTYFSLSHEVTATSGRSAEALATEGRGVLEQIVKGVMFYNNGLDKTDIGLRARAALPASTDPVPARLSDISGKEYQSSTSDWTKSWSRLDFSLKGPQRFQYSWEALSPTHGVARALADFDGDGIAELRLEQQVKCSPIQSADGPGLRCEVAPVSGMTTTP